MSNPPLVMPLPAGYEMVTKLYREKGMEVTKLPGYQI